MRIRFLLFLVVGAAVLTAGCSSTFLPPEKLTDELLRLNAANTRQLGFNIQPASERSTQLGYQYLLVFLPFGRIYAMQPEESLQRAAYRGLGLRGFKLVSCNSRANHACLNLELISIRQNAYDLLATRRIVTEATVEATYQNPARHINHSIKLQCRATDYARYAFTSELKQQLGHCFEDLINQVMETFF